MQYLVSSGVPADRFVAKSKESFESAVAMAEQLGFDRETARVTVAALPAKLETPVIKVVLAKPEPTAVAVPL